MAPNSGAKYQPFTLTMPRETKPVCPQLVRYRRIDEDTLALILALAGLAIMTVAAASMLVAFSVL
jgi:hypothetical protein